MTCQHKLFFADDACSCSFASSWCSFLCKLPVSIKKKQKGRESQIEFGRLDLLRETAVMQHTNAEYLTKHHTNLLSHTLAGFVCFTMLYAYNGLKSLHGMHQ